MTHFVARSNIKDESTFSAEVAAHLRELMSYEAHCRQVKVTAHLAAGDPAKYAPYPPPSAPPDVDAAIARSGDPGSATFRVDYAIVDRLPVAKNDAKAFAARKDDLRAQVRQMEQNATAALLPLGKWRLAGLQCEAALAKPEAQRTDADNAAIADQQVRLDQLRNIHLHHAGLEAAIEDLGYDDIDAWSPAPMGQGGQP